MRNNTGSILIGAILIMTVLAVGAATLMALGTPQDRGQAEVSVLLARPTAVAADIANQAEAQRQAFVAPAEGQAQAKVIIANTEQRIEEQKHQQAKQHQIDMMALEISRTLAVNNQMLFFESSKQALLAYTGVTVAKANAEAAQAVIGTATGALGQLALPLGALIFSIGGMGAIVAFLWTRASVVKDRHGDLVIIQRGRIMQPANSLSPITEAQGMNWFMRLMVYRSTLAALRETDEFKQSPLLIIKQAQALLAPQYASPLPASEQTMLALKQAQAATHVAAEFARSATAGERKATVQSFITAALPQAQPQALLPQPIFVDTGSMHDFDTQLTLARPGGNE